jgi:drug/metabolite transporter (DMT)-like permease
VAILLALLSAALYGAADFLGGIATRRARVAAIVTLAQGSGFLLLAVMLPILPAASPTSADLYWGVAAGIAGGVGVSLLYWGFAVGSMAIVAPVSAICAVVIPAVASVLRGERMGMETSGGILLALLAIVLVSQQPVDAQAPQERALVSLRRGAPAGLGIAFLSGVAVGLFFLCLAQTRREAEMWPLLVARGTSTLLFGSAALALRVPLAWPPRVLALAAVGGSLDMVANAVYLLAARRGALSIVVTLVSLYPASTVILARLFLGERVGIVQGAGIVLALAAVLLIVGGG